MTSDNTALAFEAQRGNRAAFERLLEEHYEMIYRVAYRFTGHGADAEDIAQEVCCALPAKLKSFRGESSFSTWLYRVVVNAARDMQKRHGSENSRERRYVEMETMLQAEARDDERNSAWLYREVAKLKPPLPETALLVLAENLSHAEAGVILGCAESTVSWRMHEIRTQLKTLWKASAA